ncbi:CPBP family intramembrane metalloprotease [Natronomonas salina]|uniref:CPBP family intramembrane glutamic endopeptidase n=1 Tax=Natronomonas salina TaxID=1710540 RepID=UPI0015B4593C|nr:CPBP family intramembrane glutamic endopeptidase [Natronomonas salina]QLD90540.1 CPBP family intramembrane metalloprotease [Natronomonas salina]
MSAPSSRSRSPIRSLLEAAGLTLLAFVISVVAGVAFLVPTISLGYGLETTWVLVGGTAAGQVGFLAVAYGFVRRRGVAVPVSVPSLSDAGYLVAGVVAALVAATGLSYALVVLDLVPESVIGEAATADPTFLLALAVLSLVLVAPAEELLFRGAVQGRLRERFGPVTAVAAASLLFGSLHLTNYSGSVGSVVAGALLIAAVGSIFGAVYELSDNLAVPVLVHGCYNAVLTLASYLSMTAA